MKRSELFRDIPVKQMFNAKDEAMDLDPEIRSIHYKAQDVAPGGLFVAIPGLKADGHSFLDMAIQRGAIVLVTQKPVETNAITCQVENTRIALSAISSRFYDHPCEKLKMIGITGTNGKTTITYLVESILTHAGQNPGVIGTIDYRFGGKSFRNPMTTPESLELHKIFADMAAQGITHVVMEASSHGIDLHRLDHCRFDVGVFTNLSQDHLDYHKTMTAYWDCKKRLFTELLPSGSKRACAVINCNDPKGKELLRHLKISAITVGEAQENTIYSQDIRFDGNGMTGEIFTPTGSFKFRSGLTGRHNLENILCAVGTAIALDIPPDAIQSGIGAIHTVPGRLERIPNDQDRFVYVDYAHTPDALKNVLVLTKQLAIGRLICVFGCGGDRDPGKRHQMGEIAGAYADIAVITSDNPRSEPPLRIIDQIVQGIKRSSPYEYDRSDLGDFIEKKGYAIEPDRRKAISLAIKISKPGDTILIAGKGHETYQIIGNQTISFDDRQVTIRALTEM